MGTNLRKLLVMDKISRKDLKGKRLAVDSFNILYQFLSTIRQRNGSLLKDSKGNVTSHLIGLFSRTTRLMKDGLELAFVFDGEPPELKHKERLRRREVKKRAKEKYEKAAKEKDVKAMKKYASRTSRLTGDMIEESKELVRALGLPVVQAPSEGEAQMAYIVNKEGFYAGISEDYDSLLYAIPRLIKNLTISRRKKVGASYITIKPKLISLTENLNKLGIDQEQLIILAILIGTDYNKGGIKGIGPKTSIKLVKKYGHDFDKVFKEAKWKEHFDIDWEEIYYLIKKMPVNKDYKLNWDKINKEKIFKLLVDKHEFSEERVNKKLKSLEEINKQKTQRSLSDF